jgi:CHAT domain-containing protein/tetratricopeptide (TPR) repeat protein
MKASRGRWNKEPKIVSLKALRAGTIGLASALIFSWTSLSAAVIKVPRDHPTIGAAVAAARAGDLIEVADGIYVEENIILDKAIRLRAERTHGAVIYSLGENCVPVFIVRAAVEIQGLVIKNCYEGITQRNSPDVAWTGHDLIFQNVRKCAVSVNDVSARVGRAFLHNIVVEGASLTAFDANDAGGIYLRNALIADCQTAFVSFDCSFFDVDRLAYSNCRSLLYKGAPSFPQPAADEIRLGPNILDLDSLVKQSQGGEDLSLPFLNGFFGSGEEVTKGRGFDIGQGFLWNLLGRACLERGDYGKAVGYFRRVQKIGQAIGYDGAILEALHGLARAQQGLGKRLDALATYNQAIALVVAMNSRLPLRIYNEGFLRDKFAVFEHALSLLVELQRMEPEGDFGRQTFVLAEKLKTLGFYDNLLDYRSGLREKSTPALERRLREAVREISLLNLRLQDESLSEEERQTSFVKLESAESLFKNLMVQTRSRNLQGTGFVDQRPIDSLDPPRDFIGEGEAVLEYIVGRQQAFGILLLRDGIVPASLGDSGVLSQLVSDYLKFLALRSDGDFAATKGAAKLGHLLLGPFKSRLSGNIGQLIIVPGGVLYGLPFEALCWEGPDTTGRAGGRAPGEFLTERFAISYAPSVSSLIAIRRRPRSARQNRDLLALADSRAKSIRLPATWRLLNFPPLTFIDEELAAVIRPFPPGKRVVLEDGKISEEAFRGLPLDRFKIIHIATHGFFDDDNWERSGLLLERAPGSSDDGVLRPTDIYDLRLDSELVVLSACQTAKGRAPEGAGLLGLSMSFLAAGSRAVLASLWNVDDRSTARFMDGFYSHLADKKTVAEALQAAKIGLVGSNARHPFFWAAFVLIGDGRGRI